MLAPRDSCDRSRQSSALPSARLGGVAGGLARQNALRNPARTAATAAALMIGLTLVTFVAVLGRALLVSDEKAVREQVATGYVITSQGGWDTVPLGAGSAAAKADGVEFASSVRSDLALVERLRKHGQRGRPRDDRARPSLPVDARLGRGRSRRSTAKVRSSAAGSPSSSSSRWATRSSSARRPAEASRSSSEGIYDAADFEDPLLGQVLVSQERVRRELPAPRRQVHVRSGSSGQRRRARARRLPGRQAVDPGRVRGQPHRAT